jgi:hypothetical protein
MFGAERPARAWDRPEAMPAIWEGSDGQRESLPERTPRGSLRTRTLILLLLISILGTLLPGASAWPSGLPSGVSVTSMAEGFRWVTDIAWITPRHVLLSSKWHKRRDSLSLSLSNDKSTLAKDGRIYLMRDWQWSFSNTFINLRNRTQPAAGDRGLTSVVVHPDFQRNQRRGFIYVSYVDDPNPGCQVLGQMCMIKVS